MHFVVHEGAVLDRVDAVPDRPLHALRAVRVRGHLHAVVVRRRHDGRELLVGELRRAARFRDRQHAACRRDLDRVRAVLVALAHRLAAAVRAIADGVVARVGAGQERTERIRRIRMPAPRADRPARGENSRALDLSLGHRAPERDRRVEAVAEVPHCREAGEQRALRVHDGVVGAVGFALLDAVQLARAAVLGGQVHVHVHESGQHGRSRQVDDFVSVAGGCEAAVDRTDSIAVHHDGHALPRSGAHPVDELSRVYQRRGRSHSHRAEHGQGRQPDCKSHHDLDVSLLICLERDRTRRRAVRLRTAASSSGGLRRCRRCGCHRRGRAG